MAEGVLAVSEHDASSEVRLATVGTLVSPVNEYVILVPGTEQPVPDSSVGELCCGGPYTLPGYSPRYLDEPEHNAVAFTSDGCYCAGDLAIRAGPRRQTLHLDRRTHPSRRR